MMSEGTSKGTPNPGVTVKEEESSPKLEAKWFDCLKGDIVDQTEENSPNSLEHELHSGFHL